MSRNVIHDLLYDCQRMVQLCYPVISTFASHVYKSALPCCPSSSVLRTAYAKDLEGTPRIHIGLRPSWNANVITLEGHTSDVTSAAYSPDGKQIVSASFDGTIRLWDAATGAQLHVLDAEESVWSVAFSPDGKEILSGSESGTVSLWDAKTGARIASQKAHSEGI